MKRNIGRFFRYFYLRFIRLQGSPFSIAMGTAIGAAIAITPTLPFHTVLIVAATIILRVNTVAALIMSTLVSNPLTFAAQYYLSWKIGDLILPGKLSWERIQTILSQVKEAGLLEGVKIISSLGCDSFLVMISGGLVLAVPVGLITYFLTFRFFLRLREKKRQKHILH